MCRFVIYRGSPIPIADLVTRPAHSIIHQSYKAEEREEPLNGDGFGVAWYAREISPEPALFRDITPAWNNENLRHVARVTRSGTILAHVRAATQGLSVIQTNCHPFIAGPYAFMHNGNLAGFKHRRRELLARLSDRAFAQIRGTTDSEHMFGLFLDHLHRTEETSGTPPGAPRDPLERMAGALEATLCTVAELVADSEETSTLNLVVTDGRNTVASRCVIGSGMPANTLYVSEGERYRCVGDVCYLDGLPDPDAPGGAVMIASEPLFDRARWRAVESNHLVLVDSEYRVEIRPLAL